MDKTSLLVIIDDNNFDDNFDDPIVNNYQRTYSIH